MAELVVMRTFLGAALRDRGLVGDDRLRPLLPPSTLPASAPALPSSEADSGRSSSLAS